MASRSFIDYLLNPGPDEVPLQEAIRSAAGVADDIAAAFVLIDAAVAATAADVVTVNAQVTYIDGVVAAFDVDAAAAIAAIAADRASALTAIDTARSTSLTDIGTAEDAAVLAITTLADAADTAITTGLSDISDAVTAGNASLTATGSTITTDMNVIKAQTEAVRDEAETARDEAVAAAASVNIPVIAPGDAGKVLTVNATEDGTEWGDGGAGSGLPIGGTTGQQLVKLSNTDGDAGWDDPLQATELQLGVIQLATEAEAEAATDATKAMTPSTVKAYIDSLGGVSAGDAASVTFTAPGTGAEQRNVKERLLERVSALDYMTALERADVIAGTQSLDVGQAINDALAAHDHVVLPNYKMLINTGIVVDSGKTLESENATLKTTSATIKIISATDKENFRLLGVFNLEGSYAAGDAMAASGNRSPSAQQGLDLDSCRGFSVDTIFASNLRGAGVKVHPTAGFWAGIVYGKRGSFRSVSANNCEQGLYILPTGPAEYIQWGHVDLARNHFGMEHGGGSHVFGNGNVSDNDEGVRLIGGGNHLHGVIGNLTINHNIKSVTGTNITLGQTFANCAMYMGPMEFDTCDGIVFEGGVIDIEGVACAGTATSGVVLFRNVRLEDGYAPLVLSGTGIPFGCVQFVNCFGPGASDAALVNSDGMFRALVYRQGATTQALTMGAAATVILPNAQSNRGGSYDLATGEYTAREQGLYEFDWNIVANGVALDITNSYLTLQNSSPGAPSVFAEYSIHLPKLFSTTKLVFDGAIRIALGAGAKVRLRIVVSGTSGSVGDSLWYSTMNARRVA